MNKIIVCLIGFIFLHSACVDSSKSQDETISRLNGKIDSLEKAIATLSKGEPLYWYAFRPTTESNIVTLERGQTKVIDQISLEDSVDAVYNFKHIATVSQLRNESLSSFFSNFRSHRETHHASESFGPMAEDLSFGVRIFVVCEEPGLPIETENCTDNIYILVQPTELGLEPNLFRVSRLFDASIKSLTDSERGIMLTLEHSRFPRKELKLLINPTAVRIQK